jgi:hypothetical protein
MKRNPAERWAGRGLKPLRLTTAIKGGKKIEGFAIGDAAHRGSGRKKARGNDLPESSCSLCFGVIGCIGAMIGENVRSRLPARLAASPCLFPTYVALRRCEGDSYDTAASIGRLVRIAFLFSSRAATE